MKKPWYVLTGGPGAGKSTSIADLEKRGHVTAPEMARRLFQEKMDRGEDLADIKNHMEEFQHTILERQLEMEVGLPSDKMVFFDRGLGDQIAYYRFFSLKEDKELEHALSKAEYKKVFLLAIVNAESDGVREESVTEAAILEEYIRAGYERQGFEIVHVPVLPVAERTDFILSHV